MPGLVGLRAIASLMVCFFHGLVATENVDYAKDLPIISGVIQKFFLAVEIFLAMAGFLGAQSLYRSL